MSHRRFAELLPWYVNATLADRERREVESHLSGCGDCAGEVDQLRTLEAAVRATEVAEPAPAPQAGLSRTLRRLDQGMAGAESGPRPSPLDRPWADAWAAAPRWARLALAAQLVIIGLLSVLLVATRPGPDFETAAGPAGVRSAPASARLAVAFEERATEADVRRVIVGAGGTIVGGPSPDGLYTIDVPLPTGRDEEAEAALRRLRQERVVRLAVRRF